jgi:hypothetical protein
MKLTNTEILDTVIKMLDNAKERILGDKLTVEDDKLTDEIALISYDLTHITAARDAICLAIGANPEGVKNEEPLVKLLSAFKELKDGDFDHFEEELDNISYEIEDIIEDTHKWRLN